MQAKGIKKSAMRIMTSLTAAVILLLALVSASFAWFAMQKRSDGQVGFEGGSLTSLEIKMASVDNGQAESDRAFVDCVDGKIGIENPTLLDGSTYYNIPLTDMDFGVIDNLSRLKPENIVYLRLKVQKMSGSVVKVNLKHNLDGENPYFFDVYKNAYENDQVVGQEKLDPTVEDDKAVLDSLLLIPQAEPDGKGTAFLQYAYAFSAVEYEGNELASAQEGADGADPQLVFSETLTPINLEDNENVLSIPTEIVEAEGEFCYLYIKITLNLMAFAHSIEHLAIIMPCLVLFRMEAGFEILPEIA